MRPTDSCVCWARVSGFSDGNKQVCESGWNDCVWNETTSVRSKDSHWQTLWPDYHQPADGHQQRSQPGETQSLLSTMCRAVTEVLAHSLIIIMIFCFAYCPHLVCLDKDNLKISFLKGKALISLATPGQSWSFQKATREKLSEISLHLGNKAVWASFKPQMEETWSSPPRSGQPPNITPRVSRQHLRHLSGTWAPHLYDFSHAEWQWGVRLRFINKWV